MTTPTPAAQAPVAFPLPKEVVEATKALIPAISVIRGVPRSTPICGAIHSTLDSATELWLILLKYSPNESFAYWTWYQMMSGEKTVRINGIVLAEIEYWNRTGHSSEDFRSRSTPPLTQMLDRIQKLEASPQSTFVSESAYWKAMREAAYNDRIQEALVYSGILSIFVNDDIKPCDTATAVRDYLNHEQQRRVNTLHSLGVTRVETAEIEIDENYIRSIIAGHPQLRNCPTAVVRHVMDPSAEKISQDEFLRRERARRAKFWGYLANLNTRFDFLDDKLAEAAFGKEFAAIYTDPAAGQANLALIYAARDTFAKEIALRRAAVPAATAPAAATEPATPAAAEPTTEERLAAAEAHAAAAEARLASALALLKA